MCAVIEPRSVSTPRQRAAVAAAQLQRLGGVVGDGERAQLEVADRDRLAVAGEAQARRRAEPPIARQVPRLIHSGMPWRSASVSAQPMWSPCSWVTKTASRSRGGEAGARQPRVELAQREAGSRSAAASS